MSEQICLAKQYFQKTRRGKVLRVVRERYLRDDLGFGAICSNASGEVTRLLNESDVLKALRDEHTEADSRQLLLVVDTNVVLRQLTAFESDCPAVKNLVVCDTVLNETKKRDAGSKNRMLALLRDGNRAVLAFPNENHKETFDVKQKNESDNDYNDRLVRNVARFFSTKLKNQVRVIMLSDDVGNLERLKMDERAAPTGCQGMRMVDFARELSSKYPRFIDNIAQSSTAGSSVSNSFALRPAIFPEHLSQAELEKGIKSGKLFQGTLRTKHSRDCTEQDEGTVLVNGLGGKDEMTRVTIVGFVNLNRAIEGDRVAIEVLKDKVKVAVTKSIDTAISETKEAKEAEMEAEDGADGDGNADPDSEQKRIEEVVTRTGRVVGIIKKNWRPCVGNLVEVVESDSSVEGGTSSISQGNDVDDDGLDTERTVTFVPLDSKFPHMLVRTRQMETLKNDRVVVQMDGWDRRSRVPTGHFVKSLGPIGDKDTETACTLFEHDIPTAEFSTAVMACLPRSGRNWTVDEEPLPSWRVDLRDVEQVCSVDPPGCKDIDDALHARVVGPDRLEIGVHIADVSNFVLPGTPLDLEAKNRGTSTYLVERRLDMLPALLTTDICSLVGHRDRFCFTVTWETNFDGTEFYGEPKFFKSVIRSRGALTYDEAQTMIVDPNIHSVTAESIRALNKVAKQLRAKRVANGALTLASQEVRFELDEETQDPTSVKRYIQKDAHLMVEEFMLLANCAVAEKIERSFPKRACLRRHPKPSREMLDQLVKSAAAAGVHFDVSSSKALADSLDRALKPDQPFFNQLLRIMTTRAMQQAKYFCSGDFESRLDYAHYGLAVPVYTHFTSPIRRYADLVVHRMLGAAIGLHPLYDGYEKKEDVRSVTDNLNKRHRNAQKAGRASSAIHTVVLFRNKPPVETDGYVSGISASRVNVMIPEYGLEEVLTGMDDVAGFKLNEDTFCMVRGDLVIKIFDKVKVKLYVETVGLAKKQKLVVEYVESSQKGKKRLAESSDSTGPAETTTTFAATEKKKSKPTDDAALKRTRVENEGDQDVRKDQPSKTKKKHRDA